MSQLINISKFLSLVLRHKPEEIGLIMDSNGWVDVDELIEKCNRHGMKLDFETLEKVVLTNDKQRFAFNEDCSKIRANQGHSLDIELNLEPKVPLETLYHGTVAKYLD